MVKNNSEVENEVYRFIKILVIVVIFIVGMYFLTNSFANKEYDKKKDSTPGEISTHNIIVGSLFNRPYEAYYVIAYKSTNIDASLYETIINMYASKEDSKRIYAIDLDNVLNKDYYSDEGNSEAQTIEELKISSPTLIKIKDKKIATYIEGLEKIKKELGI